MGDVAHGERDRVEVVHRLGLLDTPPEERFDRIARLAQQLFHVPSAMVSLVDEDRVFYKSHVGSAATQVPRQGSFCGLAMEGSSTFVVEDASLDPRFASNPYVLHDPKLRFYAGRPLVAPGGHRVGTLCVADTRPRTFSAEDRDLLRDLARWVEKELAVEAETERAAQVQVGLLPEAPPRVPGYDVAGTCLPARAVGGDFYDWEVVPGGVVVTIADVMGKGMGAAIIAATVRAVLRSGSRDRAVDDALADTQAAVEQDLVDGGTFVTVLHARLDTASGVLTLVDAGHGLTVVVRRDGAWERVASGGPPLGIPEQGDEHAVARVVLGPGDLLVTFSDGVLDVLDVLDASAEPAGPGHPDAVLASLERVAGTVRGAASAQQAVDRLVRLAPRLAADRPDDLTVLALRRDDA